LDTLKMCYLFLEELLFSTKLVVLTAHVTLSVATCDTSNSCCMQGHECMCVNEIYSLW